MGVRKVIFPCDLPHWNIVSQQLLQLQFYCQSSGATPQGLAQLHQQIFLQIRSKGPPTPFTYHEGPSSSQPKELSTAESQPCVYQGLVIFLEQVASIDEKDCFLHFIFPAVIDMACNIKELIPQEGIPLCRKQCTKSIAVSRNLMSAIISCAFLCLFPERKKEKTSRLNNINFSNFFRYLPLQSQCAKLRCILHYFRRVASAGQYFTGEIEIQRQVMEPRKRPTLETWKNCSTSLCPIYVRENGKTYDASSATLKIGFANRFLGGHILSKGRCQEEIIYMTCPELLASTLFMEAMDDNEAITIKGFEKFSEFSGYGENLKFSGNYCDKASRKSGGNLETMLSAINTLPYKFNNQQRQYMDRYLLRDLNKCLVGFQPAISSLNHTSADEDSLLNQVCVNSETQTVTTEIVEDTILVTNVESSNLTPPHKSNVASNTDEILIANEATDVEGERKEVKFVEDIDSFAKRLTKEILTESLCELNPQCTCNNSDDVAPRFDKEFKSIAKFIPEHCSLYGSGLLASTFGHTASMDYLDVDYHDWISNFRRRSSNLSDLTSRRSSCSTRYSSDISSDFEELYESFMKRELTTRPGTIHEEIGTYNVQDFAANFIENLLQESAAIVYNTTGMQNFQNIHLPSNLHKPVPIKFGPEPNIDRNANVSFISEDTVQGYVDHLFEDIKVTIVDSEEICLQCENKEQQRQCSFFSNLSTLKDLSDASIMSVDPACNIFRPAIPEAIYSYSDYLSNEILCDSLNEISSLNISSLVGSILSSNREYKDSPSSTELDLTAVADKLVNQIFREAKAIVNCTNPSSASSSRRQSLWSNSSSLSGWMNNSLSFGCWINDLSSNILDSSLKTAHKISMFIDSIECHGVKAAYTSSSCQGVYLPDYDKYALTITKELFTNALLELHENYLINPYYRQLLRYQYGPSLPNMTSVEDMDCCGVGFDHKLVPQEDLANFYMELERQSSLSEQNKTIEPSMSGFRDITLSQFAEELMRTDATSQSLLSLRNNWHQESFHSGSLSGFKDNTLASFEDELLRSCVDSPDSLLYFDIRDNFQHQESVISRTDISDDPTSKDFSEIHSMSLDSDDNLSTFADQVSEEIMYESFVDIFGVIPCNVQFKSNICLQCLEMIADEIAKNVIHVAILTLQNPSCDYSEDLTLNLSQLAHPCLHRKFPVMSVIDSEPQNIPPPQTLNDFYENTSKEIIGSAILTVSSCRDIYKSNCRALVSSCGIPGSNPQLEVLLQWIVASYIQTPVFICYTKQSEKLVRFPDVVSIVQAKCWTVGDLMCSVHKFCNQALEQLDSEGVITLDLFEEVIISAHRCRPVLEISPDDATVIAEVPTSDSTVVDLPLEYVTSSNNNNNNDDDDNGDVVPAASENHQILPTTLLTSESDTVIDDDPD
ncbi:uncharacterized protein LOC106877645 isoform X2 [Octopus bimaculoides]|uniref:poly(ADP-ribose) glycohydrolase n=2 Tax=Octopus bimaculoides TaxID=37653 RepID=A0A0L8GD58_OCTBM|nr:uncharacterized protein LOC106877645 isoform X2 [Octopus bimaculoides]|eukprot:XP_014782076.1 PREDICTED: uncharacterized protein LOC106877645 [Octopus bimaculoides]